MKYISLFLIIVVSFNCFSQEEKLVKKDTSYLYNEYIIFEGDTVVIKLDEVMLLGKLKFQNNYDRRYYYWFRKKTLKGLSSHLIKTVL